jgi:hypothetical protein
VINFYERYYGDEWYLFSLHTLFSNPGDLSVDVFSDYGRAGYNASIAAYQITDNHIKILIRHRTQDNVPKNPERGYVWADISYYYLIEFEENDGKIESYCNRIQDINLSGFIINDANISETINMKLKPSFNSNDLTMQLMEGDIIEVVGIEKVVKAEYNTYDHWCKISVDGKEYWVFGIYINFSNRIKIFNK